MITVKEERGKKKRLRVTLPLRISEQAHMLSKEKGRRGASRLLRKIADSLVAPEKGTIKTELSSNERRVITQSLRKGLSTKKPEKKSRGEVHVTCRILESKYDRVKKACKRLAGKDAMTATLAFLFKRHVITERSNRIFHSAHK